MFLRAFITMVAADAIDRRMRRQQLRALAAEQHATSAVAHARRWAPLATPAYDPRRPERPW